MAYHVGGFDKRDWISLMRCGIVMPFSGTGCAAAGVADAPLALTAAALAATAGADGI